MKQNVINSISCVQDKFTHRKNTVELFGYDFMVDDNFNCWLIEVNSSPAMDYSTKVTTRLVKQVLKDTAKVIVDWKDASRKKKKKVDTGLFQLIK
jgi:tubulin monoglycylase TTLL3/8